MEMLPEVTDPRVIDGRKIAQGIEAEVKKEVEKFIGEHGIKPGLATILVGEHPPSKLYVKLKHWACKRVGIYSEDHKFQENTKQDEIINLIETLNRLPEIHGILVQLPLPGHIDEREVMMRIAPEKDVDGFNPLNMGKMFIGREGFVPCTPKGIIRALEEFNIDPRGREVVVVGHSNVVGKPAAVMLLNRNATVKVCHVFTKDLKSHTREADILIVATGVRGLIKADMVKEGAIVFDVGITWQDEKVYGDVDFDDVLPRVRLISPVPGGVGPMTIAILMEHTLMAAKMQTMKRKIVSIDEEKCDGCGLCIPSCAEGAIKLINGKAKLVDERFCDGLGACLGHCPQDAITILEREVPGFDEEAVKKHLNVISKPEKRISGRQNSELRQWPVQLTLVSPEASYFRDAELLVAADCVPFAYPNFHSDFLAGKSLIIGCPKLDDAEFYIDKLTEILKKNNIKGITLVNMEVPCCFGLQRIVEEAVQRSGKVLPIRQTVITIKGDKQ